MVLDFITERGQSLIGGANVIGWRGISTEQGGRRVPHRSQCRTNQVDQLGTQAFELLDLRFPGRLTPFFATCHGQ